MNISKRDTKLLLILLGLIIFLLGYFAVYNSYRTKTEGVEAEISALRPELEELRGHYAALNEYYAGIDAAQEAIVREKKNFPSDVRSEDVIMYAVELEERVGLNITGIGYSRSDPLAVLEIMEGGPDSLDMYELTGCKSTMSAACTLSYDQLKELLEYIVETKERTTLDAISIDFDASTGELSGEMSVDKFFLYSGDEEYVPTAVPAVPIGTEDLFGTFAAAEAAAEAALAEANEGSD